MTRKKYNNYITESFDKEHTHFGGIIYLSDFNTDYRIQENKYGSSIAARIESDFRWEKNLMKGTVNKICKN